jgi:hypothetical protein
MRHKLSRLLVRVYQRSAAYGTAISVGLSAWPSGLGHAPSCFIPHEFDGSRVQIPEADTVNQAVHPSGVGKLVAISMQWVTAVEDCEGKRAAVRWLARGLCSRMAQTTTRRFPAVSTGDLSSGVSCLMQPHK